MLVIQRIVAKAYHCFGQTGCIARSAGIVSALLCECEIHENWGTRPMQVWDSLARSSTHTVSQKDSILIRQANDSGVSDPCYVQLFFPDELRRANFHRASSIH